MRIEYENLVTKEAAFKESKKTKKKNKKLQNQVAVVVMIQTKMNRWLTS